MYVTAPWIHSCHLSSPLRANLPSLQTEFFQDDLFPPTFVSWESVMTAAEWLGGTNRPPRTLSLQPKGMISLSQSRDEDGTAQVLVLMHSALKWSFKKINN